MDYDNLVLLIPIYEPNNKVIEFLKSFQKGDFSNFIVVNDGSDDSYEHIFETIKNETLFHVIKYDKNHGKGFALKTGIKYIRDNYSNTTGIVTCDSDGQHSYLDVLKVRDALIDTEFKGLIMGTRSFSKENSPKHNRMGNKISSFYYHLYTKQNLDDTQSGLRGIPSLLFNKAITVPGSRYDYEMNFLMDTAKECPIYQVPIQTIYDKESNKESHFNPVLDSIRIYRTPILYVLVALLSFGLDSLCFFLFDSYVFSSLETLYCQLFSVISARLLSGTFNFLFYFFLVFPSKGDKTKKIFKYITLFICNMALSFAFTALFSYLGNFVYPSIVTAIKIIVDLSLAIINFFINWLWVFAKKTTKQRKEKHHE